MRWLTLIAVSSVAACSMMQPGPSAKAPTAERPAQMMSKADAQRLLADRGFTSAALVPSGTYIGGWSGTANYNGSKVPVAVDKAGNIHS